jgi:O-antigen biosynthesis protein
MVPGHRNPAAIVRNRLQTDQAQIDTPLERQQHPEAESQALSVGRFVGRIWGRLRQTGDRLTGGGLRAFAKRTVTVLAAAAGSDKALEKLVPRARDEERTYAHWVAWNDTIRDADRAAIHARIASLPFSPLISVIIPASSTSEVAFSKSFKSVVTQLYPYWELCATVDDASHPLLSKIFGDSAARDPRIKVTQRDNINCTAAAAKAALSLATGEFVAFLRVGDILAEQALYEVASELGGNEQTDIIYTDHDQISLDDERSNPWFKPGWDPDLLLAQDYISDLVVYRRTLVEKVGFLRPEFEGAEFHDLALRATAATTRDRIRHLPAILYHRYEESKTIHSEDALSALRAVAASRRAVRDHLDSRGHTEALVKPAVQIPSANRIVWPLPNDAPLVSVIIPTRDRADLLAQCVAGVLHRTDYCNLELLIVDNESVESATLALFDRLTHADSRVHILHLPGPFNYSTLNNAAARKARGEVLLLLNNDIDIIDPGWLREMVSHALRPDVGIVGAKLLYANEQIQHGGIVLGPAGAATHVHRLVNRNDPGYFGQLALARSLSAVTGACMAIRRQVFFEAGGLNEANLAVAYNDVDLCLRVGDRGYRVVWTPFAELFHLECASRGLDVTPAKRDLLSRELEYMRTTWGALFESADPFHNPNLLFAWDGLHVPSVPRRQRPWQSCVEHIST